MALIIVSTRTMVDCKICLTPTKKRTSFLLHTYFPRRFEDLSSGLEQLNLYQWTRLRRWKIAAEWHLDCMSSHSVDATVGQLLSYDLNRCTNRLGHED
jgi:hypothetical protein